MGVSATYYATAGTQPADNNEAGYSAPIDVLQGGVTATNKLLTARLGTDVANPQAALATDDAYGTAALTGAASAFVIRMSGMYKTSSTQRYFEWGADVGGLATKD